MQRDEQKVKRNLKMPNSLVSTRIMRPARAAPDNRHITPNWEEEGNHFMRPPADAEYISYYYHHLLLMGTNEERKKHK
jgi:hypothetical protein